MQRHLGTMHSESDTGGSRTGSSAEDWVFLPNSRSVWSAGYAPALLRRANLESGGIRRTPNASRHSEPCGYSARLTHRRPKRRLLLVLCLPLLLAVSIICCNTEPAKAATTPSPFYLGADISTLTQVDQRGGV